MVKEAAQSFLEDFPDQLLKCRRRCVLLPVGQVLDGIAQLLSPEPCNRTLIARLPRCKAGRNVEGTKDGSQGCGC